MAVFFSKISQKQKAGITVFFGLTSCVFLRFSAPFKGDEVFHTKKIGGMIFQGRFRDRRQMG